MKGGKASLISEHGRKEQVEVALDSFWRLLFSWKHTARHLFSFRATCLCWRKFCKCIQKHSMKSFCPSIFRPLWFSAIFVLLLLLLLSGIIHLAQARPSGNDVLCWRQKTSLFCLFLPNFQTVFFKFLHAATLLVSKVTVQQASSQPVCVLVSPTEVCSASVITAFTSVTIPQWAVRKLFCDSLLLQHPAAFLARTFWTGSYSSPSSSSSPSSNPRVHELWCADTQALHVLAQQHMHLLFGMKNKTITIFVLGWSLEGTNFKLAESFIDTPPKKRYSHTFPRSKRIVCDLQMKESRERKRNKREKRLMMTVVAVGFTM